MNTKPVEISPGKLTDYMQYFLSDYLKDMLDPNLFNPQEFIAYLKADSGCNEINDFIWIGSLYEPEAP